MSYSEGCNIRFTMRRLMLQQRVVIQPRLKYAQDYLG